MKIIVLDGYGLNPGDLTWKGFEELVFKKELEPKHFSDYESSHLGQVFSF